MIAYLKGILFLKKPDKVVLLVNGTGYEVFISLNTFKHIADQGKEQELFIYTIHKEDAMHLYGFYSEKEKEVFQILLKASGVGPKLAITVLSNLDIETFKKAIAEQNVDALTKIGGIGRKRAEKLVFELKEKFADLYEGSMNDELPGNRVFEDAVLALKSLGYSHDESMKMIRRVKPDQDTSLEELIKKALSGSNHP